MAKKKVETSRKGRPPGGPFWHSSREQWICRVGGRMFYAPRTIGQTNTTLARKWYIEMAESQGIAVANVSGILPGTETKGGLRKLVVTMTAEVAAELAELDPLVAAEQLSAATNYSRTISVAIHEGLARRKGGKKG